MRAPTRSRRREVEPHTLRKMDDLAFLDGAGALLRSFPNLRSALFAALCVMALVQALCHDSALLPFLAFIGVLPASATARDAVALTYSGKLEWLHGEMKLGGSQRGDRWRLPETMRWQECLDLLPSSPAQQ